MGSCVPFVFPWASLAHLLAFGFLSPFTNFVFSWLLLTSLGFPSPITSYSSLGFMGLPSIPYSFCLHCFGPTAAHSYFFSHHTLPMGLLLTTSLFPGSFEPIYLFHGPVIHYSSHLDLMVFVLCLLPNSLCCWVGLPFLHLGFTKKRPSTVLMCSGFDFLVFLCLIFWVWCW